MNTLIFLYLFINPIFQPIVTEFERDYGQQIRTMRIDFDYNMGPGVVGYCHIAESPRRISINPAYWDSFTDAQKKQTLYHELGHCELNRKHVQDPNSIMFPYTYNDYMAEDWNANPDEYLEELFKEDVPRFTIQEQRSIR